MCLTFAPCYSVAMKATTDPDTDETQQTPSDDAYLHLRTAFEREGHDGDHDTETLSLLLKGLEQAKMTENEAYSQRHMRIYGMLRQAMDYVYDTAPEKIGALKKLVRDVCRDIEEKEWDEMTDRFTN